MNATERRPAVGPPRWAAWCLYGLSAFQVVIAVLLYLNWNDTVDGFTGEAFAPRRDAAEGAAAGALGVHVLLAVLFLVVAAKVAAARRWARIVATVLLAFVIVGGIGAMLTISEQTPLNPIGVALALAAVVLLWMPTASRGRSAT
ncbi:MAG TPA: hypothetical protein VE172_21205 [Stackebrandtia sp.]|uniref:hypothetical protein n=1 Tax=Stackebrandtia sp. TaxID=2023065 RepID=UPI002D451590|nr:hypothetical protein [Stackebrandtia sp.]HZE41325.1 hypothetical protein [Stackebrandtia sp.]